MLVAAAVVVVAGVSGDWWSGDKLKCELFFYWKPEDSFNLAPNELADKEQAYKKTEEANGV